MSRSASGSGGGAARTDLLERIFDILESFHPNDVSLPLAVLARRAGLPKPTVHRLAARLVQLGMLGRTAEGQYYLGVRLFKLGALEPSSRVLREIAVPYMEDLFEAFHQTVHLAMLDGSDVLYIERVGGHDERALPTRVGGRFPAHASALGKVLMAYGDPSSRPNGGTLRRIGPRTVTDHSLLEQQLVAIRREGVAVEYEESVRGVCCVAGPIMARCGLSVGAVSVTGSVHRMDIQRIAHAVRRAVRGATEALANSDINTAMRSAYCSDAACG